MKMGCCELVWRELLYRRWAAVVSVLVAASSVAAVVFFLAIADLAAGRTRIIQRDLGLNLRLIPADTDLDRYWIKGYAEGTMDQALLARLERQQVANRLVPMLQRAIPWGESEAILTGVGEELFAAGERGKPVFGRSHQAADTIVLGAAAADRRGLAEDDRVEILGRGFRVESVLAASGSVDDVRVYAALPTVQAMLDLPNRLNEIRAIECHCDADTLDPEEYLRSVLEPLLPGTRLIRQDRLAETRRHQRLLAAQVARVATPMIAILAVFALGGLAFLNTHQRRAELGLLASLGRPAIELAAMVWLRAMAVGVVGGLLGVLLGWYAAGQLGPRLLGAGPKLELDLVWLLAGATLGGAVASIAALIPAAFAARTDPALLLREM
jgi:putative ABC transport system permease protein